MKRFLLLGLLFSNVCLAQQDPNALKYSKFIDSVRLKSDLTILASDAYEGRETGKKGQVMAANFIKQSFMKSGCPIVPGYSGYEQFYKVVENVPGGKLTFDKKALSFKKDFFYYGGKAKHTYSNLPVYTLDIAKSTRDTAFVVVHYLSGKELRSEVNKLKSNLPKGTKCILLIAEYYKPIYDVMEHYVTEASMRLASDERSAELPILVVNKASLAKSLKGVNRTLLGEEKSGDRIVGKVGILNGEINTNEQLLTSSNVLAFVPGSDPLLSKEVVVMSAHHDHIGVKNGVVYNGADDDGTGTVALLSLAEAFMQAYRAGVGPKRSILFLSVSGEEKGLLGSEFYSENPILPLEETVVDLNIDMIGRNDIGHEKEWNYIYIIGSNMLSDDLHNANEKANKTYTNIKLDYHFNSLTDPNQFYYRSDHYNFAKHNIPVIFYFSGVHDDYHQPTDDVEKINFTKVERVTRLVFFTAWDIANAPIRPRLN